jgi:hypothetical protein
MTSLDVKIYEGGRLGVARCAATGAVLFAIALFACWVGAVFDWPAAPHWLLSMFTDWDARHLDSPRMLRETWWFQVSLRRVSV